MNADLPVAWHVPGHAALRHAILPAGVNQHFDDKECTMRIAATASLRKGQGESYSEDSSWTCRRIKDEIQESALVSSPQARL